MDHERFSTRFFEGSFESSNKAVMCCSCCGGRDHSYDECKKLRAAERPHSFELNDETAIALNKRRP
jgi:hypothetical protein